MNYRNLYLPIFTFIVLSGFLTTPAAALTWKECVILAKQKSPLLKSAKESIIQKKADTGNAVSPLLPQASASLSGGQGSSSGTESKSMNYSVDGKQLIFDGLKSVYDVKSAKASTDAAIYEYMVVESDLRLTLRQAYVRLLSAHETLAMSEKIVKRRKENCELVTLRYQAGREHRGALLTARANLSQAEADLAESRREISLARRKLATAIGIDDSRGISAEGELVLTETSEDIPDFENIARNAPLLVKMQEQKKAAILSAKSLKLAFFPSVYGYFNAGKSDSSRTKAKSEWDVGLQMSVPISDGGTNYNNARKADSLARQAEEELKSERLDMLYTLEEKWHSLRQSIDRIKVSKQYLEAATERSKITEAQYSIGQATFDNWTIIEDNLVEAQKDYLNKVLAGLNAEAEWVQAKGGDFSYDQQ